MLEIVYIIIALGLTILVHELGHFLVAKALKIRVEAFSIGFGPQIVSWKSGDTEYRLSWLFFLGGYVKLSGEDPEKVDPSDEKAFLNQHPFKKILIAVSGVIQNFIFAFVLVWVVFMAGTDALKPVIGTVKQGYPAAEAGLRPGDEVISVNGKEIKYWGDLTDAIVSSGNTELVVAARRGSKIISLKIKPRIEETEDHFGEKKPKPVIGITPLAVLAEIEDFEKGLPAASSGLKKGDVIISVNGKKTGSWDEVRENIESSDEEVEIGVMRGTETLAFKIKTEQKQYKDRSSGKKTSVRVIGIIPKANSTKERYGPVKAADKAARQVAEFTDLTVRSIYKMITRKIKPDVAGPIGVMQISYEVAKTGLLNLLFLFAIININLALVNFLPVLPLDGGLALVFLIEWLTGRKMPLKAQETLMQIGWMLLIALLFFLTYQDILRLVK
ncbi:MAG TPA: RIP metalloprotease RseP [Candidatus Goldiibacteriota bacterium]|mgnify:CR=1 FL=1|nr:RIP metalloprotease RseP [Candidatus Goldiibacteriota bacterium]